MSTQKAPAGMVDQGFRFGQAREFTIFAPIKQGGAARMRERFKTFAADDVSVINKVATVHDLRVVIFDNDSRLMFATTYDGGFEQYIKDFSTIMPDNIDRFFSEAEGYPGVRSPEIWNYIARHQVEAAAFYSAYPDVTVRNVWKSQRVLKAFEDLLDQAQS